MAFGSDSTDTAPSFSSPRGGFYDGGMSANKEVQMTKMASRSVATAELPKLICIKAHFSARVADQWYVHQLSTAVTANSPTWEVPSGK